MVVAVVCGNPIILFLRAIVFYEMLNYANVNAFWFVRSYCIDRSVKDTVQDHQPFDLIHNDIVSHSVYARSRVTVTGLHVALVCSVENADQFLYILAYH